jgi:hypothetical protein
MGDLRNSSSGQSRGVMLARLGQILYSTARWPDTCFAMAGVAVALLLALGVPWYFALMWGVVIGTPSMAMHVAVSNDEAKWPIVSVILCIEVLWVVAALVITFR